MKVLVLSLNAWNTSNSTGNTLSNLFSELREQDEVANIFCRDEAISNTVCKRYFRVAEKDIIRNVFTPKRCGNIVIYNDKENDISTSGFARQTAANLRKSFRFTVVLLLRELIWLIPVWKNNKLKRFVIDFGPDIIYMHGHYNLYMHHLLSYCQKLSGAKVAMYWGDDMYGRKSKAPLKYFYESLLRRRFRESIRISSLLFGGSLQLCEEYSKLFNKTFIPFFKECKHIGSIVDKGISNPLTIVYAGNLLFGREDVMVDFVRALSLVNSKGLSRRFLLRIYSNTNPSDNSLCILDDRKNSFFMGCRPYEDVCEEMDKSDLALFIESFNKRNILSTRLSFSTKIIDCMQSSAGILAIGPSGIASMNYMIENKLGITITDLAKIEETLSYLAGHPEMINQLNENKIKFARKYHIGTSEHALAEIRKVI